MNRKRALISDAFVSRKRKDVTTRFGLSDVDGPTDVKAMVEYLMTLFPRRLFNDALPQIVLKHQLYSLISDKTMVDKGLNKLREQGDLLMFQLDLSFSKDKMLKDFLFTDAEITQLVKSGVLTVRDAGSWWLAIPNSGKFTKYFLQGRKAVLNMVKKSKYNEVLKVDLEDRKTPAQVKFHIKYHIHDIVGAELVESIPTTSGTLLRYVD
uniref:Serine/threonine kinase 19 n=1 Tax=Knipowitschia caucasica TaxID=637954 RepID=A0AAV2KJY2_KNICA